MIRLALIDDILGAPPARAADGGLAQTQFKEAAGQIDALLLFADAWDEFLEEYTAEAAVEQFDAWREAPDMLLVDMMFDNKASLGLEILARLRDHPLVPNRRAVFSTRNPHEEVFFEGRDDTLGGVAAKLGARYVQKDETLRPGELIARLTDVFT